MTEDLKNSAIVKIIANKDREYNALLTKNNKLLKEHTNLVNKFVDLKVDYGNLKGENRELRKIIEKQRVDIVKDLKNLPYRIYETELGSGKRINQLQVLFSDWFNLKDKWEGASLL